MAGTSHRAEIIGAIVNNVLHLKLENPLPIEAELKRFGRRYTQLAIDVFQDAQSLLTWTRDILR